MQDLKVTNRYRKVRIEEIVFLQGQDYSDYVDGVMGEWEDEIQFLLQWYYPNENHMQNWYSVKGLNTDFLGNLIKIPGYTGYFLFTKNTRIGYIGLSRVVEFSMKIIDQKSEDKMTRTDARRFAKLLFELIQFLRKRGGNKDTYILNKLTECKDLLLETYSTDNLPDYFIQ